MAGLALPPVRGAWSGPAVQRNEDGTTNGSSSASACDGEAESTESREDPPPGSSEGADPYVANVDGVLREAGVLPERTPESEVMTGREAVPAQDSWVVDRSRESGSATHDDATLPQRSASSAVSSRATSGAVPTDEQLAAVRLIADDVRERGRVVADLLGSLTRGMSEANQCVTLAGAKLAHEMQYPDTRHGGAPGRAGGGKVSKDPEDGSLAFVDFAGMKSGWSRSKVGRMLRVGLHLYAPAHDAMQGTPLANRVGELEQLAVLEPDRQLKIATLYQSQLVKEARKKLRDYYAEAKAQSPDKTAAQPTAEAAGENPAATRQLREIRLRRDGEPVRVQIDGLLGIVSVSETDVVLSVLDAAPTPAPERKGRKRVADGVLTPPTPAIEVPLPPPVDGATAAFHVQVDEFRSALDRVRVVAPRPVNKENQAGHLVVVQDGRGFIYSADAYHLARAEFAVDVQLAGKLVVPWDLDLRAAHGMLAVSASASTAKQFVQSTQQGEVMFEDRVGGRFVCASTDGLVVEGNAIDVKWFWTLDKELEAAKDTQRLPVAVLREALKLSRDFHGDRDNKPGAKAEYKTIQLFDSNYEVEDPENRGSMHRPYEKGDGILYAANGRQSLHFECDAFKGKSLAIPGTSAVLLVDFLGKCAGNVVVHAGERMTFAVDEGSHAVFGWQHVATLHSKHSYYGLGNDQFVFRVPKADLLAAIRQVRAAMGPKDDSVRLQWSKTHGTFQLEVAEGAATGSKSKLVPVAATVTDPDRIVEPHVNVDGLSALFKDAKGGDVQLRIYLTEPKEKRPKGGAFLRTVDTFYLNAEGKPVAGDAPIPVGAHRCTVTRFMPSHG
jgi:hypothetical protein